MIKSVDQIVFKRVSKALRTEAHLASMDAGGLAVVAFAFASAGVRAPFLFDALAKRICPPHASGMAAAAFVGAACIDLTRISPGQLSKLSWSYTRLHAHTPALFAAVAHAAAPRLSEFAPADLVSLCYGVAASGYAARPLCAELLGRAAELLCAGRLAACSRSDLAVLASAFMRSCLPAERARVLRAISDELTRTDVPEKLSAMQPRELAELLFAYALSGEGTRAYASPLMRALVKEASARNAEAFKMDQRCQLFRATSVLNLEAPGLLLKLPSHLERAPIIDRDKDVGPRALSTELKALGVVHTCEFRVPGTPFVVDIALTEARAVIELQGFHSHLQRRASDECKARVLRGLGWQVVGLNSQHCAKLGKAGLLDRLARLIKEGSAPGAHVQWGLLPDRLLELLGRNIPPSS